MALRPLLHALSRQSVSFMLQDSGSLQASWPSDLLFWSDLASWQKKTFCTQTFKDYSETVSLWSVGGVEPSEQVIICARTDAGDLSLDNACNQWGNIFIIIAWPLKESLWGFFLIVSPSENITQHQLFISQSSVKALFSCGALEERSALGWTFCCLPKCFSSQIQLFFLNFKKVSYTTRTGLKCSGSRSIWYEKWADRKKEVLERRWIQSGRGCVM